MTGLTILLRKELLEAWRTLRLPIVTGVLLLGGLMSPLLARFTPQIIAAAAGNQLPGLKIPDPTVVDAVAQTLKNVGQLGGLAAILIAMGAVATEVDRGTAAFVLVKPAGRAAFLVAKLATIGATLGVGTGLAVLGAALYTAVLFEPLPAERWLGLAVLLWLSLCCYASITFLGSALTRSALPAAGLGFLGLVGLSIAGVIPSWAPYLPSGLADLGGLLVLDRPTPELAGSLAVSLGIIAGATVLAILAFRRRQL